MTAWTKQIDNTHIVQSTPARLYANGSKELGAHTNPIFDPRNGKVVGKLTPAAARSWNAMAHKAWFDDQILLLPVSPVDSFRSLAKQHQVFDERYTTTNTGIKGRTCGGILYWFRKHGLATAACPGTSNHGKAGAVDFRRSADKRELRWMEIHAKAFGWQWELPSEEWHVHYMLGDQVTQAVLDVEANQEDDMNANQEAKLDDALRRLGGLEYLFGLPNPGLSQGEGYRYIRSLVNLPRNGIVEYGTPGDDLNVYHLLATGELVQIINGGERRVSFGQGFVVGSMKGPDLFDTDAGQGSRVDFGAELVSPAGTFRWFTYDPSREGFPGRGDLPKRAHLIGDDGWHYVDSPAT